MISFDLASVHQSRNVAGYVASFSVDRNLRDPEDVNKKKYAGK